MGSAGELSIEAAWYGDPAGLWHTRGKDVTSILRSRVENHMQLHLEPKGAWNYYNKMFGDPAYGFGKTLVVLYRYGDGTLMKCAARSDLWNEWFRISISPDSVEPCPEPVGELIIEKAMCGAETQSMHEVTDIVSARIQRGVELELDACPGLFGGTASDKEKSLEIRYRYGSGALMKLVSHQDAFGHWRVSITPHQVVPKPVAMGNLFVEAAWYGPVEQLWQDSGIDVTGVVRAFVQNGMTLHMNPSRLPNYFATIFGDTCRSTTNTLVVRYQYGHGEVMELVAATRLRDEGYSIIITPTATDPVAVKVKAFLVVSLQVLTQDVEELTLMCRSMGGNELGIVNVAKSMLFKDARVVIAEMLMQSAQCMRFFSPDGKLLVEDDDEIRVDEVLGSHI